MWEFFEFFYFFCMFESFHKKKFKKKKKKAKKLPSWNSSPAYGIPETVIITIVIAFLEFHATKKIKLI